MNFFLWATLLVIGVIMVGFVAEWICTRFDYEPHEPDEHETSI